MPLSARAFRRRLTAQATGRLASIGSCKSIAMAAEALMAARAGSAAVPALTAKPVSLMKSRRPIAETTCSLMVIFPQAPAEFCQSKITKSRGEPARSYDWLARYCPSTRDNGCYVKSVPASVGWAQPGRFGRLPRICFVPSALYSRACTLHRPARNVHSMGNANTGGDDLADGLRNHLLSTAGRTVA